MTLLATAGLAVWVVACAAETPGSYEFDDQLEDEARGSDAGRVSDGAEWDGAASRDAAKNPRDTGSERSDAANSPADTSTSSDSGPLGDTSASEDARSDAGCPEGGCPQDCTPRTCAMAEADCGTLSNGCGQQITCGTCTDGVCRKNRCVPSSCVDDRLNGKESDTDCGGPTCAPCDRGEACNSYSDCSSRVCDGGICAAATCKDTVQNGRETAIDCGGGDCRGCDPGQACRRDRDCRSKRCEAGICQPPTCSDGRQNGQETGVDCGGECRTCHSYRWKSDPWGSCQRDSCQQRRGVWCERDDGKHVTSSNCEASHRPAETRSCKLTTTPTVSGSWTQAPNHPRSGIEQLTGNKQALAVGSCRQAASSKLTFTGTSLSGSWSRNCSYGNPSAIAGLSASGNTLQISTHSGTTAQIQLTGATLSGSWSSRCATNTCSRLTSMSGLGQSLQVTDDQGRSATFQLGGVQVCP